MLYGSIGTTDSEFNFHPVPVWKNPKDPHANEPNDKNNTDEPDRPKTHSSNRQIRLTVDYSPLNKVTPRDRVTVPTWEEYVIRLYGSVVFTSIDLSILFSKYP